MGNIMNTTATDVTFSNVLECLIADHAGILLDESREAEFIAKLGTSQALGLLGKYRDFPSDEVANLIQKLPREHLSDGTGPVLRLILENEFGKFGRNSNGGGGTEEEDEEDEDEDENPAPTEEEDENESSGPSFAALNGLIALSPVDKIFDNNRDVGVVRVALQTHAWAVWAKDMLVNGAKKIAGIISFCTGATLLGSFVDRLVKKHPDNKVLIYTGMALDILHRLLSAAFAVWVLVSRPDRAFRKLFGDDIAGQIGG